MRSYRGRNNYSINRRIEEDFFNIFKNLDRGINPFNIPELNPDVIIIANYKPEVIEKFLKEKVFKDDKKIKTIPLVQKNIFDKLRNFFTDL